MLYAVDIRDEHEEVNTLSDYGLCILDDLTIGEAKLKENYVNIPGANGSLNLSYAPQGYATYEDREISFTLFKGVNDAELEIIRSDLANKFHGKKVDLMLPNDNANMWECIIQFGGISGYNSGKIPVTARANPYKVNILNGAKSL